VGDIATKLNVREVDVIEMEIRLGGGDIMLESQNDDGEDSFAPIAYLQATNSEPTEVLQAREKDRLHSDGLIHALEALDPRARRIIETRWLKDEDEGGTSTLHELADEFGVSAERIRQIEVQALKKMKGALAQFA
jgi:RNA polymerase sigma-32 factor